MESNCLKFYDYFNLKIESGVKLKDNISQFLAGHSVGGKLRVRMAATHSGTVINNRMYLPDKMRLGATTFVTPFAKPVLITHDEDSDPIGRVVDVRYVDVSGVVRNTLVESGAIKDSDTSVSEKSFDCFVSGDAPLLDNVEVARKLYSSGAINGDEYRGLGYIEIFFDVMDEEAAKKFLNGLYLTGSVGLRTNEAYCSVCKQNYLVDGPCEHIPGQEYDGMKCFLITGDLKYDHFAVVNDPADVHSQVIELIRNGASEKINVEASDCSTNIDVYLDWQGEGKEGNEMSISDSTEAVADLETAITSEAVAEVADTALASGEAGGDRQVAAETVDAAAEGVELAVSDGADEVTVILGSLMDGKEISEEDSLKLYDAMTKDFEAALDGEVDWERISQEMETYASALEGEDEDLDDAAKSPKEKPGGSNAGEYKTGPFCGPSGKAPKGTYPVNTLKRAKAALAYARNAPDPAGIKKCVCRHWGKKLPSCQKGSKDSLCKVKLSREQLKDLPVSAFCGPCRSFPVVDEAHYFAAIDLLGAYAGEGDKSKILACIERKGKLFECVEEVVEPVEFVNSRYEEAELRQIYDGLKNKFEPECTPCVESLEREKEKLLAEIEKLESQVISFRNSAEESEAKYLVSLEDLSLAQDRVEQELAVAKAVKVDYLALLKTLAGKDVDTSDKMTDQLDVDIKAMLEAIDIKKICDKLTNGMARLPNGETVDNPLVSLEDEVDRNGKKVPTKEELDGIESRALQIRQTEGIAAWRSYLGWIREQYELPNGK